MMRTLFVLPSLKTNKQYKYNITLIFLNNCVVAWKLVFLVPEKKSESDTKFLCKSLPENRRVEFKPVKYKIILLFKSCL